MHETMIYRPMTPFKRVVDAVVLQHHAQTELELPEERPDKWQALNHIAAAREVYDLSDRDLAILQALVSFHQGKTLEGDASSLVVYPSNKALCERLHGMPESTLRRRLASLVGGGIIVRRDSPNGKRYSRLDGTEKVSFGFDLTPLVIRYNEFRDAAEAVRQAAERYKRLRESVSLMRRDLASLAEYGEIVMPADSVWAQFAETALSAARTLRRKLAFEDLLDMAEALRDALDQARDILEPLASREMSANDVSNERHIQNSHKESTDSEKKVTKLGPVSGVCPSKAKEETNGVEPQDSDDRIPWPNMPLPLVMDCCKEIQIYAQDGSPIRHWHELVRTADTVVPMMGISPSAWHDARACMGPPEAAVVVAAMLERIKEIHSPGGYLRALTAKAADGKFSSGPMVMALMRRHAA